MNFTSSGCVVLLRASALPATASSSATLPLLLLNTDLKGTLLSKAFVPVLRTTSIVSSLCSCKQGENQFYSSPPLSRRMERCHHDGKHRRSFLFSTPEQSLIFLTINDTEGEALRRAGARTCTCACLRCRDIRHNSADICDLLYEAPITHDFDVNMGMLESFTFPYVTSDCKKGRLNQSSRL